MKHLNKKRGQALTEYILIAAFVGLVLAVASADLFESVKRNYYTGMLPISNANEIPEAPEGSDLKPVDETKPVARINGPKTAHLGEKLTFTDDSYDPDGFIKNTNWGMKTITKTFMEDGEHVVMLEVVDDDGNTDRAEIVVTVGNQAPVAVIEVTPNRVLKQGESFTVSGSKSHDIQNDKLDGWEWYMTKPDGTKSRENWPLSGNTFAKDELPAGTYKFELKVMDQFQKWSTVVSKSVSFNRPPTEPVINQTPTGTLKVTDIVKITASGSTDPDGDAISYVWTGRLAESSKYPPGRHTITVKAVDSVGNESKPVGISFYVIDPATGTGGVVLNDSNTTIIETLPPGTTATGYTFNVPAVSGHSGNDYAYVKAFNKHTGQWEEIVRQSTRNGILLTGPLKRGTYTKVEFFYFATHCMYGKSNITYSVDFEFDDVTPPLIPTPPGGGIGTPIPTDPTNPGTQM